MDERQIFLCEDSLEGIFSGVYQAWASGLGHGTIELRTEEEDNLEFFCCYHQVLTDLEQADKVLRTIRRKIGEEVALQICCAAGARDSGKGTAIYRTLVDFLSKTGAAFGKHKLENLKNPWVRKVWEDYRMVWNEYHHYLGFLRFRQLPGKVLFSAIEPRNDVLLLFQDHFGNRFPEEYWIIYDTGRKKALLHEPGKTCSLVTDPYGRIDQLSEREDTENDYEKLFRSFCRQISIRERENQKLQQQNLPLRFRKHMVEFHENQSSVLGKMMET